MDSLDSVLWSVMTAFLTVGVAVASLVRPWLRRRDELNEWRARVDAHMSGGDDEGFRRWQRLMEAEIGKLSVVPVRLDRIENDMKKLLADVGGLKALASKSD